MKNHFVFKFYKLIQSGYRFLLIFFSCSILLSCSTTSIDKYDTVKLPEIINTRHQLVSVSDKVVKLNILFDVTNPNEMDIDSFFLDYEIFVDNTSFIKGRKVKLKLIPKGKSQIVLPINIGYTSLLSSFSSVAKLIVQGKRKLPIFVKIKIYGKFKVIELYEHDFLVKKQLQMEIPLPRYHMDKIMQFIKGVR